MGVSSPAPPSHAPAMPAASSANVDATTRLISRAVWLAMKAAARRGTPAGADRVSASFENTHALAEPQALLEQDSNFLWDVDWKRRRLMGR